MSTITIIGTGNMARTIGTLAVAGGNDVEVMGRDRAKADDLATALGRDLAVPEAAATASLALTGALAARAGLAGPLLLTATGRTGLEAGFTVL